MKKVMIFLVGTIPSWRFDLSDGQAFASIGDLDHGFDQPLFE